MSSAREVGTGGGGGIGAQLAEAERPGGDSVLGVDAFTDYYPRELKERNLEGARRQPAFRFVEADLAQADLTSVFADVDGVFH